MTSTRAAGLLLLLAAVATAVSVMLRLASSMEAPDGSANPLPIILDTGQYSMAGAARVVSGLALLAAAAFMRPALRTQGPLLANIPVALLLLSGAATAVSGACMLAMAVAIPQVADANAATMAYAATGGSPSGWLEAVNGGRWIAGKVGFTLAGLGLIALGPTQWRIGGALKISAVADVVIGVAMLFIWVDAATVMHRVSGIAFLAWLIVSGVWLVAGLLKPPQPEAR